MASLTVGSNYSLADCCDKNTTNARCYAALVLRGGISCATPPIDLLCCCKAASLC